MVVVAVVGGLVLCNRAASKASRSVDGCKQTHLHAHGRLDRWIVSAAHVIVQFLLLFHCDLIISILIIVVVVCGKKAIVNAVILEYLADTGCHHLQLQESIQGGRFDFSQMGFGRVVIHVLVDR